MRKLVVIEFISLDGVIQSPGSVDEDTSGGFSRGGWIAGYDDPVVSGIIKDEMASSFDLLLGATTYGIWSRYWPERAGAWPSGARAMKYVVSENVGNPAWGPVTLIDGDVEGRIRGLKRTDGEDLRVYGSSLLVRSLLRLGLVDELWLKVYPIVIGEGKKLFDDGTPLARLDLFEGVVGPSGIASLKYRRRS